MYWRRHYLSKLPQHPELKKQHSSCSSFYGSTSLLTFETLDLVISIHLLPHFDSFFNYIIYMCCFHFYAKGWELPLRPSKNHLQTICEQSRLGSSTLPVFQISLENLKNVIRYVPDYADDFVQIVSVSENWISFSNVFMRITLSVTFLMSAL